MHVGLGQLELKVVDRAGLVRELEPAVHALPKVRLRQTAVLAGRDALCAARLLDVVEARALARTRAGRGALALLRRGAGHGAQEEVRERGREAWRRGGEEVCVRLARGGEEVGDGVVADLEEAHDDRGAREEVLRGDDVADIGVEGVGVRARAPAVACCDAVLELGHGVDDLLLVFLLALGLFRGWYFWIRLDVLERRRGEGEFRQG